jgi:hypothetical protein
MSPRWGSTPRLTDRLTVGRNVAQTHNQTQFWQSDIGLPSAMKWQAGHGHHYRFQFSCEPLAEDTAWGEVVAMFLP